jgi:hypothetical protein
MQPLHQVALHIGVEVHERVATQQQIDTRDRRILQQVVAAEDHRPASIRIERISGRCPFEVLVERGRLQTLGLPTGVHKPARRPARGSAGRSTFTD